MTINGTNSTVEFVFFDTVIFVPDFWNTSATDEQFAWLESTLAASTADWLLVIGHYPVWSVAENGPTASLVDNLLPLMKKYRVDAYFSGHDHNLQFLDDGSGIAYFLSGAGHNTTHSHKHAADVPAGSSKFFFPPKDDLTHGGFNTVSLTPTKMEVIYYEDGGETLFIVDRNQTR